MNYQESVAFLESLAPMSEPPTLERIKSFLEWQGSIQNAIPTFHIGGTNGKGSTAIIVDTLLQSLGLKVGRFIGPHILRWNERININSRSIDDQRFAELVTRVKMLSDEFASLYPALGQLSWFEILTAMAFFHFKEEAVDYQVLEVGLGGVFDATNAADNVCGTIITSVDLDHTQILGDTVEKIAAEKAGIIKAGVPVFTYASGKALAEIEKQAELIGSPVYSGDQSPVSGTRLAAVLAEYLESFLSSLSLRGAHQQNNARLALLSLAMIERLDRVIPDDKKETARKFSQAMARIYWPGRLQSLSASGIILDGAHNPASAGALRTALDDLEIESCCFVVGFYKSKDAAGFLKNLLRRSDRVIACSLRTRRSAYSSAAIEQLCKRLEVEAVQVGSVKEGLELALRQRRSGETIVATGSFTVLKETMEHLGWTSVDMGCPQTIKKAH